MSKELTKLKGIADAKKREYDAIIREQEEAIDAARDRVYEEFADRVDAASRELRDAVRAASTLEDQILDAKTHKWEGRIVEQQITKGRFSWEKKEVTVYGIIEVRRSTTEFPETIRYISSLPRHGEPFIRLLKANGKPGLKFEHMSHIGNKLGKWKLSDKVFA